MIHIVIYMYMFREHNTDSLFALINKWQTSILLHVLTKRLHTCTVFNPENSSNYAFYSCINPRKEPYQIKTFSVVCCGIKQIHTTKTKLCICIIIQTFSIEVTLFICFSSLAEQQK